MLLQRTLRYLRDFLVIIACLLAGKAVAAILPFAFPGSIIGMLLLFVLLSLQIVRFSWVELGAACCCATWGAVRAGGGGPGGLARAPAPILRSHHALRRARHRAHPGRGRPPLSKDEQAMILWFALPLTLSPWPSIS